MAIEKSRGISITSTALQFEYQGHCLNLLDTPGHEDFSEDTYRTLAATDSAVMVLDGAKGIEPQTRKLFEVCRMRHIPIICFINKLDHPGRDPFDLVDEIERELHVGAVPMNCSWPSFGLVKGWWRAFHSFVSSSNSNIGKSTTHSGRQPFSARPRS